MTLLEILTSNLDCEDMRLIMAQPRYGQFWLDSEAILWDESQIIPKGFVVFGTVAWAVRSLFWHIRPFDPEDYDRETYLKWRALATDSNPCGKWPRCAVYQWIQETHSELYNEMFWEWGIHLSRGRTEAAMRLISDTPADTG